MQRVDHRRPAAVPVAPARGVDHHGPGRGLGLVAERARQRARELAQRGPGRGHGRRRRAGQGEQGPGLVGREPRQVGAGAAHQRPPAAPAGLRVHGDTGGRQRLQVAAGGGDGHLQLGGQLGRGHPAPGLHHEEGGDEPVGTHGPSLARKVVRR